jgi:hypothetical protein
MTINYYCYILDVFLVNTFFTFILAIDSLRAPLLLVERFFFSVNLDQLPRAYNSYRPPTFSPVIVMPEHKLS